MCDIERRELTREDLIRMRIPSRYWNATFDEIVDQETRESIQKYGQKMDEMISKGIGLLLWGDNGRGKTCAAVCLGKEFRRREKSVLFYEAAGLKTAVFNREMFDDEQSVLDRIRHVDVLLLDDVGKGLVDSKGQGERLIDELIRYRSARRLVTFITTNMSPRDQLPDVLKISTMETLKECIHPIKVEGPNRREESRREISALMTN